MHIDLDRGGPDRLDADVAVIGAGAAGLSLVRRLVAGGARIVLLESGGFDFEARIADLNAGDNVGMDYYPLEQARLRFFGGTTAIWGGRIAAFDAIDFERRDWVPHSGWPFGIDTLEPYYRAARAIFGLPADAPSSDDVRAAGGPLPRFSDGELRTPLWSFDKQFDRFSFHRNRDLIEHPRVTVVTHATVRDIAAVASGRAVERLIVQGLSGRQLDVHARHFVLAAGGIENPRILLASRGFNPHGLGNDHDQVGRYFMEHPHARGGRIVAGPAWRLLSAFAKREAGRWALAPLIAPSTALQEQEGILNTSLTIAPRRAADGSESWGMRAYLNLKHRTAPNRLGRSLWKGTKRGVGWLQQRVDPARPWLLHKLGQLDIALVVRAEQAPNPASRVMLGRDVDAIGMPRAVLDWRTTPLDVHSVSVLVDALAREARLLDLGRVEKAAWLNDPAAVWRTDPLISAHPIGGYHHMGTTRMSADPRHGVTDADGTVHGVANLHVAGSSLFPTSGWANPTLTIVALALRTGDHILAQLGKSTASAELRPERVAELVD